MAGFGRSNSLSINTGGGLLYVCHAIRCHAMWILQAQ
jgi:hypothetical protein